MVGSTPDEWDRDDPASRALRTIEGLLGEARRRLVEYLADTARLPLAIAVDLARRRDLPAPTREALRFLDERPFMTRLRERAEVASRQQAPPAPLDTERRLLSRRRPQCTLVAALLGAWLAIPWGFIVGLQLTRSGVYIAVAAGAGLLLAVALAPAIAGGCFLAARAIHTWLESRVKKPRRIPILAALADEYLRRVLDRPSRGELMCDEREQLQRKIRAWKHQRWAGRDEEAARGEALLYGGLQAALLALVASAGFQLFSDPLPAAIVSLVPAACAIGLIGAWGQWTLDIPRDPELSGRHRQDVETARVARTIDADEAREEAAERSREAAEHARQERLTRAEADLTEQEELQNAPVAREGHGFELLGLVRAWEARWEAARRRAYGPFEWGYLVHLQRQVSREGVVLWALTLPVMALASYPASKAYGTLLQLMPVSIGFTGIQYAETLYLVPLAFLCTILCVAKKPLEQATIMLLELLHGLRVFRSGYTERDRRHAAPNRITTPAEWRDGLREALCLVAVGAGVLCVEFALNFVHFIGELGHGGSWASLILTLIAPATVVGYVYSSAQNRFRRAHLDEALGRPDAHRHPNPDVLRLVARGEGPRWPERQRPLVAVWPIAASDEALRRAEGLGMGSRDERDPDFAAGGDPRHNGRASAAGGGHGPAGGHGHWE